MEHVPERLSDAQLLDFNRNHLPDGDVPDTDARLDQYGDLCLAEITAHLRQCECLPHGEFMGR